MPKINREEYEILKNLDDKWKWIARDDNYGGLIFCFRKKPHKDIRNGEWGPYATQYKYLGEYELLFQFIQWEDSEPYNIQELIEDFEEAKRINKIFRDSLHKALDKVNESEETEVKKNIEWLKKEIEEVLYSAHLRGEHTAMQSNVLYDDIVNKIDQLDEPEVLSQEWIDDNKEMYLINDTSENAVPDYKLQNLLVPKQEEVDQAYKDGYETGKQHAFYKGYLEGLADKENEPETVADVVTTFWKSFERLKEVMSMEIEELEE